MLTQMFRAGYIVSMPLLFAPPGLCDMVRHIRLAGRKHLDSLLEAIASAFPVPARISKTLAFRAAELGNHETALRWWREVRERTDWSIGVAGQAGALRALNRLDEADEILRERLTRCQGEFIVMVEFGWLLLDRHELEEALTVWRAAVDIAPEQPSCHVGLATTLRQMLRFDEADAVLIWAKRQFPNQAFVHSNHAVTADLRGDRSEALLRWQNVYQRFVHEPIAFAGLGAALKALGQFDEANAVLARGMQNFPNDPNIAINHAWVAVAAADWPEAIRRWTALRARWPNDARIKTGLSEASMHAKLAAADEAHDGPQLNPSAASGAGGDALSLMMGFESVGENCELGFVQRHFEAEPLGLFRWAGICYERLLDALDNELAGIGADENTILNVNLNNREYYTEDCRYGMSLHSFILEGSSDAATVKAKLCRRISYLKSKLLEDLRDGGKIFVFNATEPLSDPDLRRLHASLCRFRPVPLLHVAPHGELAPASVTEVEPLLWRGSLGRTGYNGRIWNVEFENWLAICQTVTQLHAARGEAVQV